MIAATEISSGQVQATWRTSSCSRDGSHPTCTGALNQDPGNFWTSTRLEIESTCSLYCAFPIGMLSCFAEAVPPVVVTREILPLANAFIIPLIVSQSASPSYCTVGPVVGWIWPVQLDPAVPLVPSEGRSVSMTNPSSFPARIP